MLKPIKELEYKKYAVLLRKTGVKTASISYACRNPTDSRDYYTHYIELTNANKIETAPNNTRIILLRMTREDCVMGCVGGVIDGKIYYWDGKRPPTHWCPMPPWGDDRAAKIRKRLTGA